MADQAASSKTKQACLSKCKRWIQHLQCNQVQRAYSTSRSASLISEHWLTITDLTNKEISSKIWVSYQTRQTWVTINSSNSNNSNYTRKHIPLESITMGNCHRQRAQPLIRISKTKHTFSTKSISNNNNNSDWEVSIQSQT